MPDLWQRLRRKQLDGLRFRRQVPLGPYIVDFLCAKQRLIIEVDGGQHAGATVDRTRTAAAFGYCDSGTTTCWGISMV